MKSVSLYLLSRLVTGAGVMAFGFSCSTSSPTTESAADPPAVVEADSLANQAVGVDAYTQALADPLMVDMLYRHPRRMASRIAESGAISVNAQWEQGQSDRYYIEQQRYGGDLVQAGVFAGNPKTAAQGLKIIDWGFERQGPEGDFPGTGDALHSVSFFVESSARAALILQHAAGESAMQSGEPHDASGLVFEHLDDLHRAAGWMARPEVKADGRANNLEPFTHRFFLRAAGLQQAAQVTGDATLRDAALEYARDGIARQREDGVLPERDGFDANYQVIALLYAARYHYVCPDAEVRAGLRDLMRRALPTIEARIDAEGQVDITDSTRMNEVGRANKKKKFDYKNAIQAMVMAHHVTGDPVFYEIAQRLARGRGWLRDQPTSLP